MIKREVIVVLMSTATGIGIITILSFFIVWIGFPANNPQDSFKDALGFAGGLFGGLATFGAAIIAAYLVADWKQQATYNSQITILANMLNDIQVLKEEFDRLRDNPEMYKFLKSILEKEEMKSDFIHLDFNTMNNLINGIRSKYFQLKMLSDHHDVFPQQDIHTNVFLQLQTKLKIFELKAKNIKRLNNCPNLYDNDIQLAFFISGKLDSNFGGRYANINRISISDIYDKFYNLRDAVIHYKKLLDK